MELKGAVALVTGGGRRLGEAISRALAEEGCSLVIHYGRSREEAESSAAELEKLGVETLCVKADLAKAAEIDEMFALVEHEFGRLDILVNSAATFEKQAIADIEAESWDRVLAVNLRAPFLCLRRAARVMRAQAGDAAPGLVVNIADLSGVLPWPGYAHHGVSKAGLLHLTRIAARELAPEIRVNAVAPGAVLPPPGATVESGDWKSLVRRIPAGRSGNPAEVGEAVVFLARNDFVVGECLFVDGGEHLLGAGHRRL